MIDLSVEDQRPISSAYNVVVMVPAAGVSP